MIVLDVESTGLNPVTHSILSLGALDSDEPDNQFYEECRVWDGAKIDDEALEINGFSREECSSKDKQTEAELIRSFIAWATDRPKNLTLVAQNPSFDLEFVQQACKRAGIDCPFGKRTIDIHTLCWLHMSERGGVPPMNKHHSAINLDFARTYCGIGPEPKPHNALTGAQGHAEVLSRIAYNKKLLPEFSSLDIPWTNQ